jgi:hypothetical protein
MMPDHDWSWLAAAAISWFFGWSKVLFVRFWHKADMAVAFGDVRFRG